MKAKTIAMIGLVALVFVAVAFRVPQVKAFVFGSN